MNTSRLAALRALGPCPSVYYDHEHNSHAIDITFPCGHTDTVFVHWPFLSRVRQSIPDDLMEAAIISVRLVLCYPCYECSESTNGDP